MSLNTINNQFFEQHPEKVLGEFSIAAYMNKIIVKGSKEDVVKYFDNYDWSPIGSHEYMAKDIKTYTDAFQPDVERKIAAAKKETEEILRIETQEAIEMLSELSETLSGKELDENNEAIELLKDLL